MATCLHLQSLVPLKFRLWFVIIGFDTVSQAPTLNHHKQHLPICYGAEFWQGEEGTKLLQQNLCISRKHHCDY